MSYKKPKFIVGTGIVAIMTVCLFSLGVWQTQRLQWKQNILNQVSNANPNQFKPLNINFVHEDFEKVQVKGTLQGDLSFYLGPRTWEGQVGYHLYTPLAIENTGQSVLINRGWVNNNELTLENAEVSIMGYIQKAPRRGWFTPKNSPSKGEWHFLDIEEVSNTWASGRFQDLLPYYLISQEEDPQYQNLKVLNPITMIRNNHLGYAITWFSLAFILVLMYILYIRKQRQ